MKLTKQQRTVLLGIDAVEGGLLITQIRPTFRPVARRLQQWGAISKRSQFRLTLTKFGRAELEQSKEGK